MSLSREDALAYTERYAEFQEGSVIIRVDFPSYGDRGKWLVRANQTYLYTWQDLDKIVAFARTHLRSLQLARWRLYDLAGLREKALIPYGIWIDPTDDTATCEVSYNPFLRVPTGLPELTEDDAVMVARAATGWLTIVGARLSSDARPPAPQASPSHRKHLGSLFHAADVPSATLSRNAMSTLSRDAAVEVNEHFAFFMDEDGVHIRVELPPHGDRDAWLDRASALLDTAWPDLAKMLAFARAHLRTQDAARWREYDAAGVGDTALLPFSVWLYPADGAACCHVTYNFDVELPPHLPEFRDDVMVAVERHASGWLTIGPSRYARPPLPLRCPCCYCKTLEKRATFEICPVCGWEDDGHDDHDADEMPGLGPNGRLSLAEARANYREFGASVRKDLAYVRAPHPEELPDAD